MNNFMVILCNNRTMFDQEPDQCSRSLEHNICNYCGTQLLWQMIVRQAKSSEEFDEELYIYTSIYHNVSGVLYHK